MFKISNKRAWLVSGFFVITLVYSLYNIFLVDVSYFSQIPKNVRHFNRFLSVLIVYGIGTYALKKYTVSWMMDIWHILHIIIIAALLTVGVYDVVVIASPALKNIAKSLHEFLISPVLYVGMAILNNRLLKQELQNTEPTEYNTYWTK